MSDLIDVYVFEGNEYIDERNIHQCKWDKESIIEFLSTMYTDIEENNEVEFLETMPPIQNTFQFHGEYLASIVADAEDGGTVYIAKMGKVV